MVNELFALNKDLNPKDSQRFLSLFSRQGIAVSRPPGRLSSYLEAHRLRRPSRSGYHARPSGGV